MACESFASAEDFLQVCGPYTQGCLILDVRMQGLSGPELQNELLRRQITLPIIFLTGYADMNVAVGAMRAGAIDFLPKPVNGALLLQRVQGALDSHAAQRQVATQRASWEARLDRLTQRERQVLALTLEGLGNKEIANALDISVRTIEGHRARIYLKAGVTSLMELVHAATQAHCTMTELLTTLRPPPG
jgi:two-component system response regulator DctR